MYEQVEGQIPEGLDYQAYADYYATKWHLITEHKELLDKFEELSNLILLMPNSPKIKEMMCFLQSKMERLKSMYQDYKSIQNSKEEITIDKKTVTNIKTIFTLLSEAQRKRMLLSYHFLYVCKEALTKCHYILGLNNIESEKVPKGKSVMGS